MIYEIPVLRPAERAPEADTLSRRGARDDAPLPMPRDARPSRARRERLPVVLREWGARSRRITPA